ncbi:hypothetical protein BT96DRAFT_1014420 [Gymnopus androsaceus JB14]|uniref:Uncharacterized protein n=1 Tax=Gymnopus androsaceus JB14 TaxID=1447944 RepID=A0A6A4I8V7_9AGAR|nr:hypothetical protein BT96DRAFT_1014420 [Gymnopus androsaceus JB14]
MLPRTKYFGQRVLRYSAVKSTQAIFGKTPHPPHRDRILLQTRKFSISIANKSDNPESEDRPLCSEDFIRADHVKMATGKPTMFDYTDEGLKEVPIPDSVRESGVVPSGYSIDFILSPERIVSVLKKAGITMFGQLPEETFHELRGTINNPSNLSIVPTRVYELKREEQARTDSEFESEGEEKK